MENAELYLYWQRGEFQPYSTEELVDLLVDIKPTIPRYCRVNRVIRDIPSTNVVAGNKRTSLRMDVQAELEQRGQRCQCLRCREVRGEDVKFDELQFDDQVYQAGVAEEHFLSATTMIYTHVADRDLEAGMKGVHMSGFDSGHAAP